MKEIDKIKKAYLYLKKRISILPETIIVLGSGLGGIVDEVEGGISFPFSKIPYVKTSTTSSHEGRLVIGTLGGKNVAVMSGRVHLYEDNTPDDVVRLIRVLYLLGAKRIILTNSAGAINKDYEVGDVVQITDHVSLFVPSPLKGDIRREIGRKLNFVDMSEVYDRSYIDISKTLAKECDITYREGVYVQLQGGQYETPFEIKLLKKLGCDLVGMSTVIEAIASVHLGLKVCAFSTVTNMACGIGDGALSHEEVKLVAGKVSVKFRSFIKKLVQTIG